MVPLFIALQVHADIGETHELQQQRNQLLQQVEVLRSMDQDSSVRAQMNALTGQILELDGHIFKSYEETVDRMLAKKTNGAPDGRLLVMLAMITTAIALFLSFLILMARNRVVEKENAGLIGVYRQLSSDFMKNISPEKSSHTRLLRVNVVVILGLIMMGASIIAFLIGTV